MAKAIHSFFHREWTRWTLEKMEEGGLGVPQPSRSGDD